MVTIQYNGETMMSAYVGNSSLPQLPKSVRRCHIIPVVKQSLIPLSSYVTWGTKKYPDSGEYEQKSGIEVGQCWREL